jgi:hypothetical protein
MTVQDLINILSKIEDKEQLIKLGSWGANPDLTKD